MKNHKCNFLNPQQKHQKCTDRSSRKEESYEKWNNYTKKGNLEKWKV